MASKTIHTLAYKLLVDSSQFEKGMIASRKELNQARRVMRETITPAEKIQTEFAKLGNLLKKGAIDQDVFNRKAAALRDEYDKATGAAQKRKDAEEALNKKMERGRQLTQSLRTAEEKHIDTVDELRKMVKANAISQETYNRAILKSRNTLPSFIAAKKRLEEAEKREAMRVEKLAKRRKKYRLVMMGIAGATTAGIVAAGGEVVRIVNEQINRIDALAKSADNLGMSTRSLTQFQFIAGKFAGLSDESTAKAFEKMTRRVSEAAAGGGEAVAVLQEIGLEANSLAMMKPEAAFLRIARAMDKVKNSGDRVRIATKLFDDEQSRIHLALKLSNKELSEQAKLADRLGVTFDEFDASEVMRAKDAIDEMNRTFEGLAVTFTRDVVPAITQVSKELNSLLSESQKASGQTFTSVTADAIANSSIFSIRALNDLDIPINPLISHLQGNLITSDLNPVAFEMKKHAMIRDISRDSVKNRMERKAEAERKQSQREEEQRQMRAERHQKTMESVMVKKREAAALEEKAMAEKKARAEIQFARQRNDMQFQRLNAFRENMKAREQLTTTQGSSSSTGPLESIAAGSSEAFKFLNQTTAARTIEVQLAQEQTEAAKSAVQHLNRIEAVLTEQREMIEERADQLS